MSQSELTEGQHRFFDLLNQVTWLQSYWDTADRSCQFDRLKAAINSWSPAEQELACFFVMVWFGKNRMDFDCIEAASVLDRPSRMLIARWIEDPFWP